MVGIEYFFCFGYIKDVLGLLAPWEIDEPVKVCSGKCRFSSVGVHHIEAVGLLDCFFFYIRRHLRGLNLFFKVVDLLTGLFYITQLGLDGLELFTQIVLALALVHLFFGLALDLTLHLSDLKFFNQQVAYGL